MNYVPLAERVRPQSFDDMAGEAALFGPSGIFRKMTDTGFIPNMIFFGPSGTGKTTAANILAKASGKTMYRLNATTASVADIKTVINDSGSIIGQNGVMLYLDEIQYFNKKQQQSLLEYIEDGRITLICSTTENPYFYIYPALISRSSVFEFKPVKKEQMISLLLRAAEALKDETPAAFPLPSDAVAFIAEVSCGDVRRAVTMLESVCRTADAPPTKEHIADILPEIAGMTGFDRADDGHYDLLSALQKSIRGSDPDAAAFYVTKILAGGDMISACRRLQVIAAEDIGLAVPQAICVVRSCVEAARELGMPEARIPLAEAAVYLATLPKSNSSNVASERALADIEAGRGAKPPRPLRMAAVTGENTGKAGGYLYPHDFPKHWVKQQYLPDDLKDKRYYEYGENKTEQAAKAYWDQVKGEQQ